MWWRTTDAGHWSALSTRMSWMQTKSCLSTEAVDTWEHGTPPSLSSKFAQQQQKQLLSQPYGRARMPVYRPSTNSLGKGKIGGEQELAEGRNRHHAQWCLPFFHDHELWPFAFLNLEAIGKTRLGKHDSPAGGGVLQALPTTQTHTGQQHSLLQQRAMSFHAWLGNQLSFFAHTPQPGTKRCHYTVRQIVARMCCHTQTKCITPHCTCQQDLSIQS